MTSTSEWETVQGKAFAKWINQHIKQSSLEVNDIKTDLADGTILIQLLQNITRQPVCKSYNEKPKSRIHKLENINQALKFLTENQGLKLVNIGNVDIADCNIRITLALIWQIILHYQVSNIEIEGIAGKSALLLWCQRSLEKYRNVSINNFTTSWQDGLGFTGLVARYRPDLVNFEEFVELSNRERLERVFQIAKNKLNIPCLLEASDFEGHELDEKSIITYVSEYFKTFAPLSKAAGLIKALKGVIRITDQNERLINDYEQTSQELLDWINSKIDLYKIQPSTNKQNEIEIIHNNFQEYLQTDKPSHNIQLINLEGVLSKLHTNQKRYSRPHYDETIKIEFLNQKWDDLNEIENVYHNNIKLLLDDINNATSISNKIKLLIDRCTNNINNVLIISHDGNTEQQLDQINQNIDDLNEIKILFKEITELIGKIEHKYKDISHIDEKNRLDDLINKKDRELTECRNNLEKELVNQKHLVALLNDYKKNIHKVKRELEVIEDKLGLNKSINWEIPSLSPLPNLNDIINELTKNNIQMNPSFDSIECEYNRIKAKLSEKIDEHKSFVEEINCIKEKNDKLKIEVKKFEEVISQKLKEINEILGNNDTSKLQQLYQDYLLHPFLKDIDHLPTTAKANLTLAWNNLGKHYKDNFSQNNDNATNTSLDSDQIQEITQVFSNYDKSKSGKLNENEYQSCLTSLGYVIGEEFSGKLDEVDQEKKGHASLKDMIGFLEKKQIHGEDYDSLNKTFQSFYPEDIPVQLAQNLLSDLWENCQNKVKPNNDAWNWREFLVQIYKH